MFMSTDSLEYNNSQNREALVPWSHYVTILVSEKYFISHINPVLCLSYKLYCMICMQSAAFSGE